MKITKGKVRRWLSEGRSPKVVLFMLELWERKPELHKMKLKDEKGYPTIDWERSEETIMDIAKKYGFTFVEAFTNRYWRKCTAVGKVYKYGKGLYGVGCGYGWILLFRE